MKPSQKIKLRWFIYLMEDTLCGKQYIGSTTDNCSRWSNAKSACNKADSNSTGLYKHFQDGCPNDTESEKSHIRVTLRTGSDWQDMSLVLSVGVLSAKG